MLSREILLSSETNETDSRRCGSIYHCNIYAVLEESGPRRWRNLAAALKLHRQIARSCARISQYKPRSSALGAVPAADRSSPGIFGHPAHPHYFCRFCIVS